MAADSHNEFNKLIEKDSIKIKDFFNSGIELSIPNYQREYKWDTAQCQLLLTDMIEAYEKRKTIKNFSYRLGTIILYRNENKFDIIDGQQRIITLILILKKINIKIDNKFKFTSPISKYNILKNYKYINDIVDENTSIFSDKTFIDVFEFVVFCVDNIAECFQLFDAQNSRGKPLEPHDLLKSYHLRHMRDDPCAMDIATRTWEEKEPSIIKELFSKYLFPILNWSRKIKSPIFSKKYLDTYKGIPSQSSYNYAKRILKASPVFQIPEMFTSGNDFFLFVDHYIKINNYLQKEVLKQFSDIYEILDKKGRNRLSRGANYSLDLFLCLLLAFYDRFNIIDESVIKKLFKWAIMIRIDTDRLGFDTINKYAIGEQNNKGSYTNTIPFFEIIYRSRKHSDIKNIQIISNEKKTNDSDEKKKFLNILENYIPKIQ